MRASSSLPFPSSLAALLCAVAAWVSPARAQDFQDPYGDEAPGLLQRKFRQGENWFKVYGGKSFTVDDDININQPGPGTNLNFRGVSFKDDSFTSRSHAPYYGIRFGHFLNEERKWNLMLDYTHYKMISRVDRTLQVDGTLNGAPFDAQVPMDTIVQKYNLTHGVNIWTLNLARYWPLDEDDEYADGTWNVYAGGGLGFTYYHPETTINFVKHEEWQFGDAAVQGFVGLTHMLSDYFDIFGEYKFSYIPTDIEIDQGRGKVDAATHHVELGLGFHWD